MICFALALILPRWELWLCWHHGVLLQTLSAILLHLWVTAVTSSTDSALKLQGLTIGQTDAQNFTNVALSLTGVFETWYFDCKTDMVSCAASTNRVHKSFHLHMCVQKLQTQVGCTCSTSARVLFIRTELGCSNFLMQCQQWHDGSWTFQNPTTVRDIISICHCIIELQSTLSTLCFYTLFLHSISTLCFPAWLSCIWHFIFKLLLFSMQWCTRMFTLNSIFACFLA